MSAEHDLMTHVSYLLTRVMARSLKLDERAACNMATMLMQDYEFVSMLVEELPPGVVRKIKRAGVMRDFTGNNHEEVMRKHNISRATLYRIIGCGNGT